jgi:hypothetical protein
MDSGSFGWRPADRNQSRVTVSKETRRIRRQRDAAALEKVSFYGDDVCVDDVFGLAGGAFPC